MIRRVTLLKSQIKTHSFLEDIVTSRNDVFNQFESDVAVGIRKLGCHTPETTEGNDTANQCACS